MTIAIDTTHLELSDDRRRALLTLAGGIGFGLVSTALFWRAGFGLNFFLWTNLVVGSNVFAFGWRRVGPVALGAIASALIAAFSVVRFQSEWALAIGVPAVIALLALLPVVLRDRATFADLSRLDASLGDSLRNLPGAAGDVARLPRAAVGAGGGKRAFAIAKGLIVGVPIAGLFAALFSNDHGFKTALRSVTGEIDDGLWFTVTAAFVALLAIGSHTVHARTRRAEVAPVSFDPYRVASTTSGLVPARFRVSALTWSMILGQVIVVFTLFVAANARHLFGGESVVRSEASITYASYLHDGFGQLLVATVLAVCLVLAGHAFVAPNADGKPGRTKPLAALEVLLVVGAGLTLASCYQRLSIYEDAYGATELRLGVRSVELFIAGVLALTAAKSVFRRWTGYVSAVVVYSTLFAVGASQINADDHVVRTNLDRAERGRALDLRYLATFSEDAASALDHPYVKRDGRVEWTVRRSICKPVAKGWRAFRGLVHCPENASEALGGFEVESVVGSDLETRDASLATERY